MVILNFKFHESKAKRSSHVIVKPDFRFLRNSKSHCLFSCRTSANPITFELECAHKLSIATVDPIVLIQLRNYLFKSFFFVATAFGCSFSTYMIKIIL
ncbi:CLUMA_CG003187, isoform A [Clunio marinus]|uniref:CLUMA_CG003187, isoform A n=1 Tax=Clunio marinus TaxID=568069 RepID=A0A1J1HTC3_9DIPT|nr:CLUMA_CG003187, isoform A [Clunio marinus]